MANEIIASNQGQDSRHLVTSDVTYQLVIFSLLGEEFGVSIREVREIISNTQITPVPQAPSFVEGVINLRGQIIPVVDLRRRFNLPENSNKEETSVVIIEVEDNILGLIVDSVSEVLNIPADNIKAPPSLVANGIGAEYIKGIGQHDDKMIILIDLQKVFSAEELQSMQDNS